jgi:hypothetical protein
MVWICVTWDGLLVLLNPPQDSTSCRAGARPGHPISGRASMAAGPKAFTRSVCSRKFPKSTTCSNSTIARRDKKAAPGSRSQPTSTIVPQIRLRSLKARLCAGSISIHSRISLRPRDARHGRQRDSARGQMQKLSAGKCRLDHLGCVGRTISAHRRHSVKLITTRSRAHGVRQPAPRKRQPSQPGQPDF